jgi:hypothetical protein
VEARTDELASEAAYLHHSLYGTPPSPDIVSEYVRAHRYYCVESCSDVNVQRIIERRLDVEALEVALRRQRPGLTRKLRMLVYITEARAPYYARFVNESDSRARAWVALAGAVLRTAYKLIKGRLILWRTTDV